MPFQRSASGRLTILTALILFATGCGKSGREQALEANVRALSDRLAAHDDALGKVQQLEERVSKLEADGAQVSSLFDRITRLESVRAGRITAGDQASVASSPVGTSASASDTPEKAYAHQFVRLDNVRVDKGQSRMMETGLGMFATLANDGARTLDRVELTIYFLDAGGRRIGEMTYSPIVSGEITLMSVDTTPLRAGYRRDFGCMLSKKAPSGWSEQIETAITSIRFAAKE